MQADGILDFMTGVAVEGIALRPSWQYYRKPIRPGSRNYRPSGRPFGDGGVFLQGDRHDPFVAVAGRYADEALCRQLVADKVRTWTVIRHYWGAQEKFAARHDRAAYLLGCGALAGVQGMVLFLLALGGGLLGRRSLAPSPRQLLPYVPPVLLAAVAAPAAALAISRQQQLVPHPLVAFYWGLLALSVGVVVVLAIFTRGGGRLRRWARGVAMLAPVALVITSLGYLAMSLDVAATRAALTREIAAGGWTEMGMVKRSVGAAWEHPKIPKGAWRNEPVPPGP